MNNKLIEKQYEYIRKREKTKLRRTGLVCLLVIAAIAALIWLNDRENQDFEITYYQCASPKITDPIRIAALSDLHNWEFGDGNTDLVLAIEQQEPDLIVILGDMVNSDNTDIHVLTVLCDKLGEIAPTYMVIGNHEGVLMYNEDPGKQVEIDKYVVEAGVTMFYNNSVELLVNGNLIQLGGISSSAKDFEQWSEGFVESFEKKEGYKILLSHYPNLYYEDLKDADIDLAFAGHYHGGLIRIPGKEGLYHTDDGFFPRYSGGIYELGKGTLIVSRGLGNHGLIPRINNRPELVITDIQAEMEAGDK